MKKDIYLKIILTIIAICLVWICLRDLKIEGTNLHAKEGQFSTIQDVRIVGSTATAFFLAEPIQVKIKK